MSNWISVKDRLPYAKPREYVPCLVLVQKVCGGLLRDMYEIEVARYTNSTMAFLNNLEGVKTHWMPMPDLPAMAMPSPTPPAIDGGGINVQEEVVWIPQGWILGASLVHRQISGAGKMEG